MLVYIALSLLSLCLSFKSISFVLKPKLSSLSLSSSLNNNNEININVNSRNNIMNALTSLSSLGLIVLGSNKVNALDLAPSIDTNTNTETIINSNSNSNSNSNTKSNMFPEITNKVYIDIKISNYTEESIGTNKGAQGSGRIVIGNY
jgi:hypothetical protein